MNLLLCIKRPFIWLSRFRYRCGYGVHSPFAFSLITDVIYEKMPYYAYSSLKKEQKKMIREREPAPLLRPGQLETLELAAGKGFFLPSGVQVRRAYALKRSHGA